MKIIILSNVPKTQKKIVDFLHEFKIEDNEISSFENGYEALDYIKRHGVDIVFSDIEMPYMDGFEFAEMVLKVYPDLKGSFFAISGNESRESYQKMEKTGVHRFLQRPIEYRVFKDFIIPEVLRIRFVEEDLSAIDIRHLLSQIS